MFIESDPAGFSFKQILSHAGHHIECATYGNEETGIVNVSVECKDCNEVLFDMEKPESLGYIPATK